jgi:hypothetical protein
LEQENSSRQYNKETKGAPVQFCPQAAPSKHVSIMKTRIKKEVRGTRLEMRGMRNRRRFLQNSRKPEEVVIPGKRSATRNPGFLKNSGFRLSPE